MSTKAARALIALVAALCAPANAQNAADKPKAGLALRLSDAGEATPGTATAAPGPAIQPLDELAASALLAELPPLAAPSPEAAAPFRERSLPPPRAGRTVSSAFSPANALPTPPARQGPGPLRVLRHMPEGDAALTSHLGVTFSQPMIPLAALADPASGPVPVRLSPQPAGQWRWVGADTLVFEPKGGFSGGTEFSAEIAAGTRSAVGGTLALPLRWSFRTPHAKVVRLLPQHGPLRREPVFAVVVDQATPSAELLKGIEVRAGGAVVPIRAATEAEMKGSGDYSISSLHYREKDGHWLAFRCERPLPFDSAVLVTVRLPVRQASATRRPLPRSWRFRTAAPFVVKERPCSDPGYPQCAPSSSWRLVMSNSIDTATATSDAIDVSPAVEDLRVSAATGDSLDIEGRFPPQTEYTLTLSDSLRDVDGQAVGGPRTFKVHVGDESPSLLAQKGLVVLDPSLAGTLPVYVVNRTAVEVEMRAVEPADYPAFLAAQDARTDGKPDTPLPGRLVQRTTLPVTAARNEWAEVPVPLAAGLTDGVGQVLVTLRALPEFVSPYARRERRKARPAPPRWQSIAWVQVTRMALDVFVDSQGVTATVNSLADGLPLGGVDVALEPGGAHATTDKNGIARLALGDQPTPLLAARRGKDVAVLVERANSSGAESDRGDSPGGDWWQGEDWGEREEAQARGDRVREWRIEDWREQTRRLTWRRQPQRDRLAWHVFDPRGLYRPGEQVKLKGWVRRVSAGPRGDVEPFGKTADRVTYFVTDQQRNEVARGETTVNRFGGFDLAFGLPANVSTGGIVIRLGCDVPDVGGKTHSLWTRVAEYRRPEFEIPASVDPGPYVIGDHAVLRAAATYFAGGPLPNASLRWDIWSNPQAFTPPGRDGYTFGRHEFYGWCDAGRSAHVIHDARTDAGGRHALRLDFTSVEPPHTVRVVATPRVTDVNRQSHEGTSAELLVHPAALYVGLKPKSDIVFTEVPLQIEALVTDLDGKAVAGRDVTMRTERIDSTTRPGNDWCLSREPVVVETSACSVTSSTEPVACRFTPSTAGGMRVTATVSDDRGRRSETVLWLTAQQRPAPEVRTAGDDSAAEQITECGSGPVGIIRPARITADKGEYRPGEVASVTIQAPFAPAEGVLTLRRAGIVRAEHFHMETPSTVLRIPVEDAWAPNIHVSVALTGAGPARLSACAKDGTTVAQPALASGATELRILPSARALTVTVAPRSDRVRPGQSVTVDVEVRDAQGQPLADAEVALAAVDESVLALAGYRLADPLSSLEVHRPAGAREYRLLEHLVLPAQGPLTPAALAAQGYDDSIDLGIEGGVAGGVEGGVAGGAVADAMRRRSNFEPLALFAPSVITDQTGRASVAFALPDSLTRYRILAVATDGGRRFGTAESALTADLPLMVRPSLPRFLNRGDTFELPVVVQNHTGAATSVDVALRVSGIELTAGSARRVRVPADDRIELRFPARATRIGKARVEAAAKSSTASDAAEVSLPVYLPVTTETVAAYGQIDDDSVVALPITAPAAALPDYGGLSITTSSTALAELEGALLYLVTYPHECAEQVASRLLAVVTLKDMLAAFDGSGRVSSEDLLARTGRDLEKLLALQNKDGGFALWERGKPSQPMASLHAAHALARARMGGKEVPAAALEAAASYLRSIGKQIPKEYGDDARLTLAAYALYLRHLLGDNDAARARALAAKYGPAHLPLETLGWILPILSRDSASHAEAAAIRRAIANRVTETAETAHFASSYRDDDYVVLRSERRTDAVLLEALIEDQPRSTLIPKLVRGLLAQRRAGRWANTQENCFVLLALNRYFGAFEKATPEMVARAWLGERGVSEASFSGRGVARQQVNVPLAQVAAPGAATELLLAREGRGRLYYRVGLDYAPLESRVAALDRGFNVERRYEGADRAEDVARDADGTWHIRAGARVRVRLKLKAPARRYQVALVDPLPAGFEPEHSQWSFPSACWAEHENRRDDRMEAFASLLWGGAYEYVYTARATTLGEFLAPPTRAEEMYAPDTFGRSASDRVVVATPREDVR